MGTGNKGRFSERLKKIANSKRKKDTDDKKGGLKRTLLIPVMFLEGLVKKKSEPTAADKLDRMKKDSSTNQNDLSLEDVLKEQAEKKRERRLKVEAIKSIDIELVKKIHDANVKKYEETTFNSVVTPIVPETSQAQKKEEESLNPFSKEGLGLDSNKLTEKEKLEKEIINLIKKKLVKQINEYDVLQSDFWVLKEILNDDIYYEKCKSNIDEIKRLLSKINALKDKYDYLKDNTSFDYLLEVEDESLADKIISLKNILETDNLEFLVKDYKLLEEYKYLYLKLDKMEEDAINYSDEKEKKITELKNRDIDFEEFKKKVSNISSLNEGYDKFVSEQNAMMEEMNSKIDKIDSYEKIQYYFNGFGALLKNTFKYLGLLLVSPLRGMVPSIATQTVATKNTIKSLNESLHIDEKKYTIYEATDYSNEIGVAINDLDYTERLIDSTLNDIISLKNNFELKFKPYQSKFPEYEETIKKLNKIENSIVNNRIKVDVIKDRMKINEKVNSDKMAKVLKLNLR